MLPYLLFQVFPLAGFVIVCRRMAKSFSFFIGVQLFRSNINLKSTHQHKFRIEIRIHVLYIHLE